MPIGQIDINRVEDASIYVNQKFRVVVTEANQREKNLVVSASRDLLEQERAEKREETWKTLEEGQIHEGVVRSIKSFGAFVEIGGVDGLIHVGDMAWSRVSDPSGLLKPGDEVEVKVLKIDRDDAEGRPRAQAAHAEPLGPRRGESITEGRWSRARSPA